VKGLSRERVVATALELLDEEGLAKLSMRRLGERLGVRAMSLYRYVANKEELLDALFHIAKADRVMHPQEEQFLREVADIFGFDDAKFARIRAGHLGADAADPYAILGVPHTASDEEVRSAWRTLVRENHPDKLTAEGMPQDFIDVATAKMATINAAWGQIRKQRGLN